MSAPISHLLAIINSKFTWVKMLTELYPSSSAHDVFLLESMNNISYLHYKSRNYILLNNTKDAFVKIIYYNTLGRYKKIFL